MAVLGFIADSLALLSAGYAAFGVGRLRAAVRRASETVAVTLAITEGEGDRKVELPLSLLRRDVTRAELLGRIGMLPMREAGRRFSLRALSSPAFLAGINEVAEGKTSRLVIPATTEEIEQFDI